MFVGDEGGGDIGFSPDPGDGNLRVVVVVTDSCIRDDS